MKMGVDPLRSILHERTHHTIEVQLYRILAGKLAKPDNFGRQAKIVYEVWKKRGLPLDTPDLRWVKKNIEIADQLNEGKKVKLDTKLPKPFTESEMKTVEKLLFDRRSIRQFKDKPVPDEMIDKIIYAGIMSPQGCNVDSRRFIVLKDPEEWKLVRSDIPVENCVMILVAQELSCYKAMRFDEYVPQNVYYDAASAADHICLMAHALGLGACWLTHGEETQKKIREYFKLPATFVTRNHIIIGWPDEAPIKSLRMSLKDSVIKKGA
jgi:nitroreductase